MHSRRIPWTVVTLTALFATGCSGNSWQIPTAPVEGILTCQGKPVPGVQVVFSPQPGIGRNEDAPGKSALGATDEHGRFVLSTYNVNDGAVVGMHNVSVTFYEYVGINSTTGEIGVNPHLSTIRKVLPPCAKETQEIEIKPGKNDVTIELGK